VGALFSIVVTVLQKINPSFTDAINQAMFLGEAARPASGKDVLQKLGLSDSRKRIAQDAFDEFQGAESDSAIRFDPVPKVLPEFRMEYRFSLSGASQVPTPGGDWI
jgi:hypothetical protein